MGFSASYFLLSTPKASIKLDHSGRLAAHFMAQESSDEQNDAVRYSPSTLAIVTVKPLRLIELLIIASGQALSIDLPTGD